MQSRAIGWVSSPISKIWKHSTACKMLGEEDAVPEVCRLVMDQQHVAQWQQLMSLLYVQHTLMLLHMVFKTVCMYTSVSTYI